MGKRVPRASARLRSNPARRPFVKVQMDLYEVQPEGPNHEKAVLTVVCKCTRFAYFRVLMSKAAKEVAEALFDVFLDCGVIPLIIQSDLGREFVAAVMKELLTLLGSCQIFSSAFHPRTQGVVERGHRDMTALLSQLVRDLVASRPRTWPKHIRLLEARQRDHFLGASGVTPRALCNAWYGVTPLQSSLAALDSTPLDLIHDDWLKEKLRDHQQLNREFDTWEAELEEQNADRYNEQKVRGPPVQVGTLVLLVKGNPELTTGRKLLPKADGPYLVLEKPSEHQVVLGELGTKVPIYGGRPQSTSRCIHFHFPASLVMPTSAEQLDPTQLEFEFRMPDSEVAELIVGDMIAVEVGGLGAEEVRLGLLDAVHQGQGLVSLRGMVASGPGPWHQRLWSLELRDGAAVLEQHAVGKLISRVGMEANRLTPGSVESSRQRGVGI